MRSLSNGEYRALQLLSRAARARAACPSSGELAEVAAYHPDRGSALLRLIEAKGWIVVEMDASKRFRRVGVRDPESRAVLRWTDWGPCAFNSHRAAADSRIAPPVAAELRREHEDYWLRLEQEKYGLPRRGRPLSEQAA